MSLFVVILILSLNLFNLSNKLWTTLNSFTKHNKLAYTDHLLNPHCVKYTYHHVSLGHKSFIDQFITSESLLSDVYALSTIDSGLNLSDHLPLLLKLSVQKLSLAPGIKYINYANSKPIYSNTLRWDKSDLSIYYHNSRAIFEPLHTACLVK